MHRLLLPALLVVVLAGCTRMRFVVDVVPAEDALIETEVMSDDGAGRSAAKVAMIDLTGMIIDSRQPGLIMPGANPVARFTESLQKAAKDTKVKAVVVRINSPGGTVTASDVLYREIQYFKARTHKPIVVLMSGVAASGGLYVACAADEIIAHPTTVTGSIGVIIQTINFSDGMRKIGIKADAITSGPNKSMGSPFEPMPAEHRALLQGLVDEFYDDFVAVVVESRPGLRQESLAWITDGRVVTGRKAAEVGLVDRLGDLRDAFGRAKQLCGVTKARLVKYHRPLEHVGSPYAVAPAAVPGTQLNLLQLNLSGHRFEHPGFYYLWDPMVW